MTNSVVIHAKAFAKAAHQGQVRKYTGEPYFNHCENVASIVKNHTHNPNSVAAAYLHDVAEDVSVNRMHEVAETLGLITIENNWLDCRESRLLLLACCFGTEIAELVENVTDVSKPSDGNRKARKELDRLHLAKATPEAKTVKLADLIDNARDIQKNDPKFAKVYMQEKRDLIEVLHGGHETLWLATNQMIKDYFLGE